MVKALAVGLGMTLLLVQPAPAQLPTGLPSVSPSDLPVTVPRGWPRLGEPLEAAQAEISAARRLRIRELIRKNPGLVEADPRGEPVVRGEVVTTAPTAATLTAARAAGFTITAEVALAGLDLPVFRLSAPAGMSTRRALKTLRRLDPEGVYDFNHIYTPGGESRGAATTALLRESPGGESGVAGALRIGLVDGGVDTSHPALDAATIRRSGCDGKVVPSNHGTAVASLMVGRTGDFSGVAPSASLFAADVYCAAPTGGNVFALASAFSWLAIEGVRVVNVSLVGPPNATLERIISRLVESGHVIVAAVGNDGPAAPPLYPAAYPGVVGVTGVDAKRRVLLEACRGPQVAFAAPGADMAAATGASFAGVRGTSFAAPIVAGLLALELRDDGDTADAARARLAATATDLGRRGSDEIYGAGLVGDRYRADPEHLAARQSR